MLHHADNGIKGGLRAFAALCANVCCVDFSTFVGEVPTCETSFDRHLPQPAIGFWEHLCDFVCTAWEQDN
jgi:hypothetical protein